MGCVAGCRLTWLKTPLIGAACAASRKTKTACPVALATTRPTPSLRTREIWVPSDTKREDGLHTSIEEKDAEEPGSAESGRPKKADDDRRTGNHGVPKEAAHPGRKGRIGDTLTDRHAPGGTWLTKNIFAGQEGSWEEKKGETLYGTKDTTPTLLTKSKTIT
ncbi:hypothetical protein NDU88_003552 [Pleurodeles waltl]|uniref:Uncharacterized protein n=1 Tax=Pleurodeles waltl TaxID=8319 RepID=A0AAV7KWV3_PLEWA|nr:hypothetical protein NDU88_003552 [Pleurodeles waltl]